MEELTKKITRLENELAKYEAKLAIKMKGYRGVIHENALSELRHSEVMVLRSMIDGLKRELVLLKSQRYLAKFQK